MAVRHPGDHVRSQDSRICTAIGNDKNLAWTSWEVYLNRSSNEHLGSSHVDVPRPHDLVYARYCLSSKRHGCDCMGSAQLVDLIGSGYVGCN